MHRIGQAHIPGYTGYLPGKKEQVGLSFSEASRGILEDLDSMEEFHPVMPLVGERPNSVYTAHIDQDGIMSVMDGAIVNEKFTPACQKHEVDAAKRQTSNPAPHAQSPFGVDPVDTRLGRMDYATTTSKGAGRMAGESVASRVAHRRLDKQRNDGGRVYRNDPYTPS